ncbi:LamG domain-containing protein [Streptomyces sp. NBC_01750]|uniref:LamG domain-containing protein n=1 Tax=Streptomyces sp. NBC_01750 TaxID=2975928 RepID=UPI002DD9E03B|nr:LamG domain-containing protein [Streptomyces sp. NBC_01750]WSD30659.1 LamG domain-containing protein [Streptomyces sp. NBC_01750]
MPITRSPHAFRAPSTLLVRPEHPDAATGSPPPGALHQVTTIDHQGTVIAFARAVGGTDVYYDILDLKVSTAVDNEEWTGFTKLAFPAELRPAGLAVVTVGDPAGGVLAAAHVPLKAVSDEKYVHVFQQSSRGTLLMNRFLLKSVAEPGSGAPIPVLEPVWEVRFQRSGKKDIPDGPRDSQSYTAPDGTPFIEPGIELEMIRDLDGGCFEAVILPNESGTARRWQFFAVNSRTGKLDLFSFPMDDNGLFDLTAAALDAQGNVAPDVSVTLNLGEGFDTDLPLTPAGSPSATLFTLRERVRAASGDDLLLKRTARVMLAQPVSRSGDALRFVTLDFALGKDGRLAQIPPDTTVTPVDPANYALRFSDSAYLALPEHPSLRLTGSFKTEFWLYPDSDVVDDQFLFRGDPFDAPEEAAPYVKITRGLGVAVGFGTGTKAVTAHTTDAVVSPNQWAHIVVAYDSTAEHGNFSVLINGNAVPVTGADATAVPSGKPITTISGQDDGLVGVLDALRLWDTSGATPDLIGDWPMDTIDYEADPPTTPDRSLCRNTAAVHGAVLVASSAPVSADTQGNLYVDTAGLSTYAGLLTFAETGGSGSLMTGADGLVHLYFAGPEENGQDGLYCVAQYDAECARAGYEAGWTSTVDGKAQTGTLTFTAARSGTFMNTAAITVKPSDAPGLCDVEFDNHRDRQEAWLGVPRALDAFVAVLNGSSTHDLADPALRVGERTFYDNDGSYATSRLTVRSHDTETALTLLSRRPAGIQLAGAGVGDVTTSTCTLSLTFTVPQWTDDATISQTWTGLPVFTRTLLPVLAGVSTDYDYKPTDSSDATVYGLTAYDGADRSHDVLVLARPGVEDLTIAVTAGTLPGLCDISIDLEASGPQHFELTDVARDQNAFADAVGDSPVAACLLVVTDGMTASLRDRAPATLPLRDLRAWSGILVALPEGTLAPDATVVAQPAVPAAVRQRSAVTVDGKEEIIDGASTMFRCLATTLPTNGGIGLVSDTGGYTDGTANLVTAAINGGWIRVSPDKALGFDGTKSVVWDQAAPTADVLAVPGDLTVEAWCRPGLIAADDANPRLAAYRRIGSVDFPDEEISWALGLRPAPSLYFNDSTQIDGSYDLDDADCTLQITVRPAGASGTGQLLRLATTGVSKPYVTLSVDGSQKVVAAYADGKVKVTARTPLKSGAWKQVTATLAATDASTVSLRLYLDGELEGEATGAAVPFDRVPGAFRAGATNGAFPMQANGAFLWTRALPPDEVALFHDAAPEPAAPDLMICWYLTEGTGAEVRNRALNGYPFISSIINPSRPAWAKRGVYAVPWAANRGYALAAPHTPLLGGWHQVASTYRTAHAVRLAGTDYADCGNDPSLDFGSAFTIEACFTPARVDAVQTLVSKPGNYELGLNFDNTVTLSVPTTSEAAGKVTLTSGSVHIEQGTPYYVAATVTSGATTTTGSTSGQAVTQTYYLHIDLYVDGVLVNTFAKDDYPDPVGIATSVERLNLGRNTVGAAYFTGLLSDVRLWNKVLAGEAIRQSAATHRTSSSDGLVSSWRWAQSRGKFGYDDNNLNNAVLTGNDLWRLYSAASVLTLIVDGVEQSDVDVLDPSSLGGYGIEQFTVAAVRTSSTAQADAFSGMLSELRIWNRERTVEQIREEMYRELTGTETGLAGYWPFDAGSGLVADDATGHRNEGELRPAARPPLWITARAPISDEGKEVHNVLSGLRTEYVARVTGVPSAVEYADTRRDAYGDLYSVMKRCYAAESAGAVHLDTGFTVGDLDTSYAGQVQTAPSLVGFIEGAPPIPSENQTKPWWSDINYLNAYADDTTVRLTQGHTTTLAFRGRENTGDSAYVEGNAGLYLSTDVGTSLGIGAETSWTVAVAEGHLASAGDSRAEISSERELGFGFAKRTTTVDELSAAGEWESADHILNPEVGRRYVPENNGYAVVKSLTADLYLVTLKGSNTVVKMTLVPDSGVEDVNVVNFPIDAGYIKNGTLDGLVGFTPDPSFPYAQLQPASYFRPIEAYSLKRAVERQDQQLEAYYRQFDTEGLSGGIRPGPRGGAAPGGTGFTRFRDQTLPGDPSYDWPKGLAKRSVVNTYVWTAAGGLHTEETELVDTYSESFSGLSSWDATNGVTSDFAAAMVVGLFGEFDALFGNSVEVLSVRDKDSESGLGLEVEFAPDRFLRRPLVDVDGQPTGYTEADAPGKVTGYRFMSFFLPPAEHNFEAFNSLVIDQNWLNNSAHPDAAALRTATAQSNAAWRILHRTTYVSRVPPHLQPVSADTTAPPLVAPANLAENTVLTRLVEDHISVQAPSPGQIGAAVTAVLGLSPTDPGLLAHVLGWWPDFLNRAANQRSDAHRELAALRADLLGYMIQKYAAESARADGAAIAQLHTPR